MVELGEKRRKRLKGGRRKRAKNFNLNATGVDYVKEGTEKTIRETNEI